jgi:basic membrane protein A
VTENGAHIAAKTRAQPLGLHHLVAGVLVVLCAALAIVPGSGSGATRAPVRVGLVLSTGLARDDFWTGGLRRAVRELGVEGKLLVPGPREGYLPSFRSLARQRFDLIITATNEPVAAMVTVAKEFPNTRFAVLDVHSLPARRPRNVWGVGFAEQEVGYLVGYLAAGMEQRRPGRDVVSSIGGFKISQVDHFIAGYRAGARKANPRIATLNDYANSWADKEKCRTTALGQIAKGSGVVFGVAGYCGYGAYEAAKTEGVWAVAVDTDESSLGPHVLTSALKNGRAAVFEVIRATIGKRFKGGHVSAVGLRNGAVGLGRFSPKVPRSLVRKVDRIRRQIVARTIKDIPTTVK